MLHATLACVIALLIPVADAPTADELVRQLKDPEPRTRRLAAEALGRQKAETAGDLHRKGKRVQHRKGKHRVRVRWYQLPFLGSFCFLAFMDSRKR
jgi:hypothetical protein